MDMKIIFVILFITAPSMLSAVEIYKYPITWNDAIYLYHTKEKAKTVSDFSNVIKAEWGEKIQVKIKSSSNQFKSITISNCVQLMRNEDNLYSTEIPENWVPLMGWLLNCKSMEYILRMSPSKVSYIDKLTYKTANDLSQIILDSTHMEEKNFFVGLQSGIVSDRCYKAYQCQFETKNEIYLVTVLGKGDLNKDGVEDILLLVDVGYKGGTGGASMGFILTKNNHDEPLRLLRAFSRGKEILGE